MASDINSTDSDNDKDLDFLTKAAALFETRGDLRPVGRGLALRQANGIPPWGWFSGPHMIEGVYATDATAHIIAHLARRVAEEQMAVWWSSSRDGYLWGERIGGGEFEDYVECLSTYEDALLAAAGETKPK